LNAASVDDNLAVRGCLTTTEQPLVSSDTLLKLLDAMTNNPRISSPNDIFPRPFCF
jgi:hypothetical protein